MKLVVNGRDYEVEVTAGTVKVGDKTFAVVVDRGSMPVMVKVGDRMMPVERQGNCIIVDGQSYTVEVPPAVAVNPTPKAKTASAPPAKPAVTGDGVRAGMPGQVIAIKVQEGDTITADTVVVVIEAMKMENEIRAGQVGVVKSIPVKVGNSVNQGDILIVLE